MSDGVDGLHGDSSARGVTRIANRGWMPPAALAIALLAMAISMWSALQSTDRSSATTEASSPEDAKAKACSAFEVVQRAVMMQTNADLGPEPVAREAVAANARLAAVGGGHYLLHNLDASAPPELRDAMRSFAQDLVEVGMGQLAGSPSTSTEQSNRMTYLEAARPQITELCR